MQNTPILLIINGYPGSGKTTVAKLFAKKNNYALLSQDIFLFSFNAIKDAAKGLDVEEHGVAIKNMHDCALNYMELRRNIVIEGALVSISEKDPLDVRDFIKLGHRMHYKVVVATLIANEKVRIERESKRNYIVPEHIDKMLCDATAIVDSEIKEKTIIDTSNTAVEEVVNKLEKLVLQ